MCGIVGLINRHSPIDRGTLIAMRDSIAHRGPDACGAYVSEDGRVGLGHRRLSIVDLSETGSQPMFDATGRYVVTFNGEIYNFEVLREELLALGKSFRGRSDTEVLLAAFDVWGEAFLDRLEGMFAFCIYDTLEQSLFLARDRAGEKPLFYWASTNGLCFGSELKALFANPALSRILDLEALDHLMAFGFAAPDRCMIRGVSKLQPGCCLRYRLDTGLLSLRRYWTLPDPCPSEASDDELASELEAKLAIAVRRQLVADVPVGVLLSGGIDSTIITALAAQSNPSMRTFTVQMPDSSLDESAFAAQVASYYGTRHTVLRAEPVGESLIHDLARQYDEPIFDSSLVPTYMLSKVIRQECTVALGGDGGDELFGGYPTYCHAQKAPSVLARHDWTRRSLLRGLGALPMGVKGRAKGLNSLLTPEEQWAFVGPMFDSYARSSLYARDVRKSLSFCRSPEERRHSLWNGSFSALRNATQIDFGNYLSEDILVKVDRASMLTSLEVRAPWLDVSVIEFAFGKVPDRLKATEHRAKILPKLLAKRLAPPSLELERKQGFSIPIGRWLKGPWAQVLASSLAGIDPQIFDPAWVDRLRLGQRIGFSHATRLFGLMMFELWRNQYKIHL